MSTDEHCAITKHPVISNSSYRKWGNIRWAKLSQFSRFLSVPQKFSHEFLAIGK